MAKLRSSWEAEPRPSTPALNLPRTELTLISGRLMSCGWGLQGQNPGRTKYVYLQDSSPGGLGTPRGHMQYKPLGSCLASKAARSHSYVHMIISSIASSRRRQSSYLCTGFPGTVPFPGLQICKHLLLKPDAAEFRMDSPNNLQIPAAISPPDSQGSHFGKD